MFFLSTELNLTRHLFFRLLFLPDTWFEGCVCTQQHVNISLQFLRSTCHIDWWTYRWSTLRIKEVDQK